jgi:hypothetical protein
MNLIAQIGRKFVTELLTSSEANKPEAYIDRIKREFQLPEYADALLRYNSNPAYWKKLYGDDPLNSPNHPVPQDALLPRKGGSAPSSSDPVYRGFPLLPDFHHQLQMPSPVDSFATRFGKWGAIPKPPASFDERFGKWGSAPVADPRDSFNNRFGSWGSVPAAGSGDTRSPVLRALEKYRRSESSDGPVMASAQGAFTATPAVRPNIVGTGGVLGKFRDDDSVITPAGTVSRPLPKSAAPNFANESAAFDRGPGNAPGAPRPTAYRVSSAFPNVTPRDPERPVPPPESAPQPAMLSGEPILPLPHPVWGLLDRSSASPSGALSDFLAGLIRRNPAVLPSDDEPSGFDRDGQAQAWFLQRQR